jgi:hypothetical protein
MRGYVKIQDREKMGTILSIFFGTCMYVHCGILQQHSECNRRHSVSLGEVHSTLWLLLKTMCMVEVGVVLWQM